MHIRFCKRYMSTLHENSENVVHVQTPIPHTRLNTYTIF